MIIRNSFLISSASLEKKESLYGWIMVLGTTLRYLYFLCSCSVAQLYPTLCDPMDCSPPGSSVHGILQARILEWVPFPPPGDLPHPGSEPVSLVSPTLAGEFFTTGPPKKPYLYLLHWFFKTGLEKKKIVWGRI